MALGRSQNDPQRACFCRRMSVKEGGAVANDASGARDAVFVESEEMPEGTETCGGYDFNQGLDYKAMFNSMLTHGFQVPYSRLRNCGRDLARTSIHLS